ncbi:MAG: tRNA pseudouridine(55) synthase TruB [Treponema sp.]|nr:tRNA pseudouridine(55) synthase TruB [Treponema sp.]
MQNRNNAVSGVMLFAKQPGRTSFSSLSTIKKALGTGKVGHTGTLDSFADGLLVVLVGSLTRLVPHITGFDKTYLALVEFGSETDTLDPTGEVIKTAPVPTEAQVRAVLPQFTGDIMQVPPAFSALHVDGERASDMMRSGKHVELPARPIHIYNLSLLDFEDKYALLEVRCSKGTYIRALARDIAAACGSCAHLKALRRTTVGPFSLKDAAGSGLLETFTIGAVSSSTSPDSPAPSAEACDALPVKCAEPDFEEVRSALQPMTPALAEYCGFEAVMLSEEGVQAFANGRPLKKAYFYRQLPSASACSADTQLAVFSRAGLFLGVVDAKGPQFRYGFVIPHKPAFSVYSWEQITSGRFNALWKEQGTALTIGSFDGPHFGHESLFATVSSQSHLIPGVITFTRSLRGLKDPKCYAGDVASLSERLAFFEEKGFAFAVVIDFSSDFAHLSGQEFIAVLEKQCGMRFLSEGNDFHFGYKGATDVSALMEMSKTHGFDFAAIAPVQYDGEKISSSRIREALLDGRTDAASAMLNHPFVLDTAGYVWAREKDGSVSAVAGKKQLLPKEGAYSVRVHLAGGAEAESSLKADCPVCREKEARCVIKNGMLSIFADAGSLSGIITAVSFV